MPTSKASEECKAESGHCFVAGDNRASEQPALAAMHTIYLREHNRIVAGLEKLNPHWEDERLFQEGRRIMGAMNQHIVYNEFLPRIIGLNAMNLYDLRFAIKFTVYMSLLAVVIKICPPGSERKGTAPTTTQRATQVFSTSSPPRPSGKTG